MGTAEWWRDYLYIIEKDFYTELMADDVPGTNNNPPDIMKEKAARVMDKLWERTEDLQRQRGRWEMEMSKHDPDGSEGS